MIYVYRLYVYVFINRTDFETKMGYYFNLKLNNFVAQYAFTLYICFIISRGSVTEFHHKTKILYNKIQLLLA